MKIKAAIFDKDGTLFDFQATWGHWAGQVLRRLSRGDNDLRNALARDLNYDGAVLLLLELLLKSQMSFTNISHT